MHHALFLKTFHIDPNILFCKKKYKIVNLTEIIEFSKFKCWNKTTLYS